jgi:ribonuclease Z
MPEIIVLGTAAWVPDAEHDTVSLAVRGPDGVVLVDCGGSPLHKLARHGVERDEIRALIVTHRHADHLYGVPILIQGLWLGGRQAPLTIYGPEQALEVTQQLLAPFNLLEREDMFELRWQAVRLREEQPVVSIGAIEITASPVQHAGNDTIALRFDDRAGGGSVAYSADTEPVEAMEQLAAGAGLLLHEATGDHEGHSTPENAADVARNAGVERLALIHYPVVDTDLERWRQRAARRFPGKVILARDGDIYHF